MMEMHLIVLVGEYQKTKEDYSKAIIWFRLGSNQNNAVAAYNIAHLYYDGQGVTRDYDIAFEYFLKAAGNNLNLSMGGLGVTFLKGRDVKIDKYKALECFIKSGDHPEGVEELNQQGIHLKVQDKSKPFYELIPYYYQLIVLK